MAQITNIQVGPQKNFKKKLKKFINIYLWGLRNLHTHGFLPKVVHQLEEAFFFVKKCIWNPFGFFFWEWWFMRAQLSCNFSKIKMDWSWHYQMNNEAILVKQKNYQTCDEKQQCQEVKKSENEKKTSTKPTPTNITHPTDQGKKKRKNHRVSVYCLSFEKTWFFLHHCHFPIFLDLPRNRYFPKKIVMHTGAKIHI